MGSFVWITALPVEKIFFQPYIILLLEVTLVGHCKWSVWSGWEKILNQTDLVGLKKFKTKTDHYMLRVGQFGWSADLIGLVGLIRFWLVAGLVWLVDELGWVNWFRVGLGLIRYKWSGWSSSVFKSPKPPPDHYMSGWNFSKSPPNRFGRLTTEIGSVQFRSG